jgi:hypothetical protein
MFMNTKWALTLAAGGILAAGIQASAHACSCSTSGWSDSCGGTCTDDGTTLPGTGSCGYDNNGAKEVFAALGTSGGAPLGCGGLHYTPFGVTDGLNSSGSAISGCRAYTTATDGSSVGDDTGCDSAVRIQFGWGWISPIC